MRTGQAELVNNSEFSDIWLRTNLKRVIEGTYAKEIPPARHAAAKIGADALKLIKVSK